MADDSEVAAERADEVTDFFCETASKFGIFHRKKGWPVSLKQVFMQEVKKATALHI